MKKIIYDSERLAVTLAIIVSVLFAVGGTWAVRYNSDVMGVTMFFVLPGLTGFILAILVRKRSLLAATGLVALLGSLGCLIILGWEGVVCSLMALPILVVSVGVGAVFGYLSRKLVFDRKKQGTAVKSILLALLPLLLLGSKTIENSTQHLSRREIVASVIVLPRPPNEVWKMIEKVDKIEAVRPFLLKIGLPVPLRCVLEDGRVGGKRICYFNNGFIEEQITEWTPPRSMKMRIATVTVPGRHWLHFEEASYELQPQDSGTVLTRATTITSQLSPAWYWRPLERLGVEAEHNYLFADLSHRVTGR